VYVWVAVVWCGREVCSTCAILRGRDHVLATLVLATMNETIYLILIIPGFNSMFQSF
jgi:hypothetical protein